MARRRFIGMLVGAALATSAALPVATGAEQLASPTRSNSGVHVDEAARFAPVATGASATLR